MTAHEMTGVVTAVSAKPGHDFSKDNHPSIRLLDLPRGTMLHLGDEAVVEVTDSS